MNLNRNRVIVAACTAVSLLAAVPAFAGAPAKGAAKEPAKVEPAKEGAKDAARPQPAKADAPAAPAAKLTPGDKMFSGIVPQKVETGAAPAALEVKKKRGETPTVAPSKEAIIAWFTALNIKHVADEQGRVIVPFRDDAQGVNFNIILIPRVKPSNNNVWAIQAVVPLQLALPTGDAGLARALIFSNNWNNEHFLNKVSLMQPGEQPFFLLDSTLVCEAGLNQADFFNNFLVLLIQDGMRFAQKGTAELK